MTEQNKAPQSTEAQEIGKNLKFSLFSRLALSFCLASAAVVLANTAQASAQATQTADRERPAKDMRYRKRTIVAPTGSEIPRRIDFQSLSTRDSLLLPTYVPPYGKNFSGGAPVAPTKPYNANEAQSATAGTLESGQTAKPAGSFPKANREGIVPPAPPAHSAYIPDSLTRQAQNPGKARSIDPPVTTRPHSPSPQKITQLKTQSEILVKSGKLAEAQSLLENGLHEYSDNAAIKTELSKVSLLRSKSYAKAGNHELAAKQARIAAANAIGASPDLAGQANRALDEALLKSKINPTNADARNNLAVKLSGQGRYMEAEVEYRAAVNLKPTVEGNILVGDAASKAGRKQEAKAAYQEALELNPDSQKALKLLGITRYQLNDYVGANADLTRALVLNQTDIQAADTLLALWHHQVASRPQDANAHLGLARAYQVIGDLKSAQIEYKTVVALNPNHPNLPAARQSFKLALAKQEAYKAYEQAQAIQASGNILSAYQRASDAVGLYPSEKEFQNYRDFLGSLLRSQGMPIPTGPISPAIAQLAQPGEQPPSLNLPTAQALGIGGGAANNSGMGGGLIGGMPGVSGIPGATAPNQVLSPFAHENGYAPISTDTHVASISGFLDSMRTFTLQQQAQIQQHEDNTKQMLRSITGGATGALSDAGSAPPLSLPGASGVPGSSADSGGSTLPASTLPVTSSGSASDALKAAAMALANTTALTAGTQSSGTNGSSSGGSSTAAGTAAAGAAPTQSLAGIALSAGDTFGNKGQGLMSNIASFGAAAIPSLASGNVKTITKQDIGQIIEKTANHFGYGTKPNSKSSDKPKPAPTNATNTGASAQTAPQPVDNQSSFIDPTTQGAPQPQFMPPPQYVQQSMGQQPQFAQQPQFDQQPPNIYNAQASLNAVTTAQPGGGNLNMAQDPISALQARNDDLQNQLASAKQQIQLLQNNQGGLAIRANNATAGGVHIYLSGVKATRSEVQLKVTLRNESGTTIKLPSSSRAVVRSGGKETSTKIKFSNHAVNTGESVIGKISVAGANLDPAADIYLPAGSLVDASMGDLHMSAPISQK